jgi:drug/metabolite transporter (DMT)-like permease
LGRGALVVATTPVITPLAAVLQGAWLLGERLDASALLGGLLVIGGVMLTQRPGLKL